MLIFIAFLGCSVTSAQVLVPTKEKRKALYELGVGAAIFELPDYPGSEQSRIRTLGLPYGIYRGRTFRADQENGMRGNFFSRSRWDLDLSFGAAFPANSERNRARDGMPDLDWIGRVGPRLIYYVIPKGERDRLDLRLPLQATISTDFGRVDGRGFVFNPSLVYNYNGIFTGRFTLSASVGAAFATRALMDYFYQVSDDFVTPSRPGYSPEAGLLETRYRVGAFWRISSDVILAASYGVNSYEGATNRASPLLTQTWTRTAVLGFIWRVFSSEERAYY